MATKARRNGIRLGDAEKYWKMRGIAVRYGVICELPLFQRQAAETIGRT